MNGVDHDEPLRPPAPETPPPLVPFPWVQACVPVVATVGLAFVTGHTAVLGFAVLGPLFAVGVFVDGRVRARRHRRREHERYRAEFAAFERLVMHRYARAIARTRDVRRDVRAVLEGRVEPSVVLDDAPGAPPTVALGRCTRTSDVRLGAAASDDPPALARLRGRVARVSGVPLTVRTHAIAVTGPDELVIACARALVVDLIANGEGERSIGFDGGPVADRLVRELVDGRALRGGVLRGAGPRTRPAPTAPPAAAGRPSLLIVLARPGRVPGTVGALLEVVDRRRARVHRHGVATERVAPTGLSRRALDRFLASLPDGAELPPDEPVRDLGALLALPSVTGAGPTTPVGTVEGAPFAIDLVTDGPHLVVGGTTGSGKSGLLRTLAVGLAARTAPSELMLLAVDFKGGATFDALAPLPHCAGVVTDLDGDEADRLLAALTGELRRRERALRAAGGTDITDLEGRMPRLVVLVDEFQALADRHADVHEVFADLAARGRSLGIHLVLGAQRPAGAMRPALLANLGGRVCFRVTDAADAVALIGDAAPAAFPAARPGLALVRVGGECHRIVVGRCAAGTLEGIVERTRGTLPGGPPPWLPPLPKRLPLDSIPHAGGTAYGLVDEPSAQRQSPLLLAEGRRGGTLVVGAPGCGRTALARAVAHAATRSGRTALTVSPADVEAAWDVSWRIGVGEWPGRSVVLVVDDADLLVERLGDRHGGPLVERWCHIARALDHVTLVVTAQRLVAPLARLAPLLPGTVRMSLPGRHAFVLSGGEPSAFRADLPPGRAVVGASLAQIAWTEPAADAPRDERERTGIDARTGNMIVITPRERAWRAWAAAADLAPCAVPAPGAPPVPTGCVIGSAGEWQRSLGALTTFGGTLVLDGVDAVRVSALLGAPIDDPPIADPRRTVLVRAPDGVVRRADVPWHAAEGPDGS